MAKPLTYSPPPITPESRLAEAQADSVSALEDALRFLRALHEHGVLDSLTKVTRGGAGLTASALGNLEEEGPLRVLRNLSAIVGALGTLDPAETERLAKALTVGVSEGARRVAKDERASIGEVLSALRDPDVSLALGAVLGLLKGLGRGLREGREE